MRSELCALAEDWKRTIMRRKLPWLLLMLVLGVGVLAAGIAIVVDRYKITTSSATPATRVVGQPVTMTGNLEVGIIDPTPDETGTIRDGGPFYDLYTSTGRINLRIPQGVIIPSLPNACAVVSGSWVQLSNSADLGIEIRDIHPC